MYLDNAVYQLNDFGDTMISHLNKHNNGRDIYSYAFDSNVEYECNVPSKSISYLKVMAEVEIGK